MHRALSSRSMLETASAVRMVPRIGRVGVPVFRRTIASLSEQNEFLPNLLAEEGFTKFLDPLDPSKTSSPDIETNPEETVVKNMFIRFAIDRDDVCIKAHFSIKKTAESFDAKQSRFSITYPTYSPDKTPPSLPAIEGIPVRERVQEVANTMWRAFCLNDMLALKVDVAIHPDGSMSFPRCRALIDESAAHRQPEIFKHVSRTETGDEIEAEKSNLVYRKYAGGNIGTIVNGAGLAMATNDTIDLLYGKNANFLDAGGKATPETIKEAFRIVLKNRQIKVVLVNVFGGVIQGDMIAKGILSAIESLHITVPVVARIQGTNGALGMQMIKESKFPGLKAEENLYDAVSEAVRISKKQNPKPTKEQKIKCKPQHPSPFPDEYTLTHTSPAFSTKTGKTRPAVMTFAIKGQGNRRVRLTRPWRKGDDSLDIPRVPIGKVRKALAKTMGEREQEKIARFEDNLRRAESERSAAFFKDL